MSIWSTIGTALGVVAGVALAISTGGAALALMPLGIVGTTIAAGVVAGGIGYAIGTVGEGLYDIATFDLTAGSSTYSGRSPVYTVEEGKEIARCYGRCRIAGNVIRSNDPEEDTMKIVLGHSQGSIDSIMSHKINNIEWDYLDEIKWWNVAIAAQGKITMFLLLPTADMNFVIDTQTFTWKAARGGTGEVTIGGTATECLDNIVTAITADLTTVTASRSGLQVTVTAVTAGAAGNDIVFNIGTTPALIMITNGFGYLGGTTEGKNDYYDSDHYKNTLLGTTTQTPIQVDGSDLFSLQPCAYRGVAHTGFKLEKNTQIGSFSSVLVEGRFLKCEPIGGLGATTGSVTLANTKISAGTGTAFVDFCGTGGFNLYDHIGKYIEITSKSTGKKIKGWIKSRGTGETYLDIIGGVDPALLNGDFETGDPPTGWNPVSAVLSAVSDPRPGSAGSKSINILATADGSSQAQRVASLPPGGLCFYDVWYKNIDSSYVCLLFGNGPDTSWSSTSWTHKQGYQRASSTTFSCFVRSINKSARFDDIIVKQVLTPADTGVVIVSEQGGSTENWADQESGFNYNDASGYDVSLSWTETPATENVFSRNPAVIMWDFYRFVEGYEVADLDYFAFKSLEALCDEYPASGDGGPIRPPGPNHTTVKATDWTSNTKRAPFFAFDTNLAITGKPEKASWLSANTTEQRLNVDLGVPVVLTKVVLINYHDEDGQTDEGIQNFAIQGSNNADDLDHTDYDDGASGWTDVQTGLTATAYDPDNPYQTHSVAVPGTAYRYYSLKIADNLGDDEHMGLRDCCFWGRSPRYTFDYNFDSEIEINDAKKLIWQSFNGRVIRSQGKLKPVWDWSTEADGAGGLTAKTSKYSFTMDNIVKGSFTWAPVARANKIKIECLDSSEGYKKTIIQDQDDSDIETRGEVIASTQAYYITQRDVASRRCKKDLYKAMYCDFQCKLTSASGAQKLEVYDLVQVTHTLPGWTAKEFIVLDKTEDEYGRPTFLLEAYYAGVFDDAEVPINESYFSSLPNPAVAPKGCTDITATLVPPGTNNDFDAVNVSFTPPSDVFYSYTEVYVSTDDSTYYYAGQSSGTDVKINGMGSLYEPGDTVYVKLVNVNSKGVPQVMPDDYDASVEITGTIKLASFYAGLYDFWGGNAAIDNAATTIVLGNLDGVPKIALGPSADTLTLENAADYPGFFADGQGYFRAGGAAGYVKWNGSAFEVAGTLIASSIHIPDQDTTADSFHVQTDGDTWWGCTETDFGNDNDNALAYVLKTGVAKFQDVIIGGGTIHSVVIEKDTISAIGGNLLLRPADALSTSMTAADASTLTIVGNETFAVGDMLRIKDGTDDEWLEVTNAGSAPTYTVTRDKNGDYAADSNPAWVQGATVVNYGASGKGGILLTSSEANAPYLSMFTHAGEPWTTITTHLRLGNLNGAYGYSAELYGLGVGQYGTASKNWLTIEQTNGIRIGTNTTVLAQWDLSGNILIGQTGAGQSNVYITSGGIKLRNNITDIITLDSSGVASIMINNGGDLSLEGDNSNPGKINVVGTLYSTSLYTAYNGSSTYLVPTSSENVQLWLGNSSYKFSNFYVYAKKGSAINCDSSLSLYSYGVNTLNLNNGYSLLTGHFYCAGDKTYDLGRSNHAWDDAYADDWHNVADFFNFDVHDDLAALHGIKGSGVLDERTGQEIIDDNTLPEWLLSRNKNGKKILYDADGKPYLSLKACISLAWGAIRQLNQKVEGMKNEKTA